jgi:hypothetical protein
MIFCVEPSGLFILRGGSRENDHHRGIGIINRLSSMIVTVATVEISLSSSRLARLKDNFYAEGTLLLPLIIERDEMHKEWR